MNYIYNLVILLTGFLLY